jgi:hypothetical protein
MTRWFGTRRILIAVLALSALAIYQAWLKLVPLSPVTIWEYPADSRILGITTDGRMLLTRPDSSSTGPYRLYEPVSKQSFPEFLTEDELFAGFYPGSPPLVATRSWSKERITNLETGQQVAECPAITTDEVVFSSDGKLAASVRADQITVLDLQSGTIRSQFKVNQDVKLCETEFGFPGRSGFVLADDMSKGLFHQSWDSSLPRLFIGDLAEQRRLWSLPVTFPEPRVHFSSDSQTLLAACDTDKGVQIGRLNANTGHPFDIAPQSLDFERIPDSVMWSPDGRFALVTSEKYSWMHRQFDRLIVSLNLRWLGYGANHTSLLDTEKGFLGEVEDRIGTPGFVNNSGFAIGRSSDLAWYTFSPRRNWWSLILCELAGLATISLCVRLARKIKRQLA